MISAGGKYWAVAGTGAAKTIRASAAAHRMTFAFIDAFFCVRFARGAARPIAARTGGRNPISSRPTQFAYSRRPLRIGALPCQPKPQRDDLCAALKSVEGLS